MLPAASFDSSAYEYVVLAARAESMSEWLVVAEALLIVSAVEKSTGELVP